MQRSEINVLQVLNTVDKESSGPSYAVPQLARALMQRKAEVLLMSASRTGKAPLEDIDHQNHPIDRFGRFLMRSTSMKNAINSAISDIDIVHCHGMWLLPTVYPVMAARAAGKPYLIAPVGCLSRIALDRSAWKKKLAWPILHRADFHAADCFYATSEKEYREIRDFGLKAPVAIIPHGIDVEKPSSIKDRSGKRRVLFLGRVHPIKGLDLLLDVWKSLETAQLKNWELKIVGPQEGGHGEHLKSRVRKEAIEQVIFEGEKTGVEKSAEYNAADLYVLPTKTENYGVTVAEALAHGLPVITTKGAPWEGLSANNCGWWVGRTHNELLTALSSAMALDPGKLGAMGKSGMDWMNRDFSWDEIALKTIEVYEWLLNGKRGQVPDCVKLD